MVLLVTTPQGEIRSVHPAAGTEIGAEVPVPQTIRDDFREAAICLAAGCPKASLVMSRRVLQNCLKAQGVTQRNLVDAISHAVETGILRRAFHALAEEIRHYGNLGAHPDDEQLDAATPEGAETVLDFARLLVREFYEVPAAADRLRKNRNGKPVA